MDASPPFAADADRLRLLYRLPLAGGEQRILVFGPDTIAEHLLDEDASRVEVVLTDGIAALDGRPFDAVILPIQLLTHGDSIGLRADRPLAGLLAQAYQALRPGGVLIGHVDHVLSLAAARSAIQGRVSWSGWRSWGMAWTGTGCNRALRAAGFELPECYYVEPRITAPMSLVPLPWRPARAHFLRAIRRTHEYYSRPGYLLRLMLAHLGLGGLLQPHLFFWARRPC